MDGRPPSPSPKLATAQLPRFPHFTLSATDTLLLFLCHNLYIIISLTFIYLNIWTIDRYCHGFLSSCCHLFAFLSYFTQNIILTSSLFNFLLHLFFSVCNNYYNAFYPQFCLCQASIQTMIPVFSWSVAWVFCPTLCPQCAVG